jgi:molybdenum cofactor cytidylyltransferase
MMALEDCAAVLLCAGLSQRFGPGNKLLAPLGGRPLVAYASELCRRVPFARRIAVVPPDEPALSALLLDFGFELVVNPHPEAGKDCSLRLGLGRALAPDLRGVLVLLGDMPHVDVAHLRTLSAAADDEIAAISSVGDHLSPPTLIPAEMARRVTVALDRPVRASLGRPAEVTASPSMLADYDLPEQFDVAPESGLAQCVRG